MRAERGEEVGKEVEGAGKEEREMADGAGIKRARQGNRGRKQSRGDGSVYKAFVAHVGRLEFRSTAPV